MSNGQILKSPHVKLGRMVDRVCYTTAHIKSPPKTKGFVFCMSKQNALDTHKNLLACASKKITNNDIVACINVVKMTLRAKTSLQTVQIRVG